MKVSELGEFGLIDRLTKIVPINDKDVVVGYGDDCSCVNINGKLILFTNDIQVENRHFLKSLQSPRDIGWKLISVNVSDVLSCGGIPKWSQISLGLPKELDYSFIENVYKGIKEALDFYRFSLIGGNISSSSEIILDLFLVGETERFLSRSSAKEGEFLYINGYTGLSRAGLELLMMRKKTYEDFEKRLIKAFTRPVVKLDTTKLLQRSANACIDISDGLVADLGHIAFQSNVKTILVKEKIPVHPDLEAFCKKYKKDPYDYLLYGGEDYVILFSSEKDLEEKDIFKIGFVEKGRGVYLLDDKKEIELEIKGFEHL